MMRARVACLADLFPVFTALSAGERMVLVSNAAPDSLIAAAGLKSQDAQESELRQSDQPAGLSGPAGDARDQWLGLYTSGSTGAPKLVWQDWRKLRGTTHSTSRVMGWTWASPFLPTSFAGVQVALQAWISGGQAVSLSRRYPEAWEQMAQSRVDAVSCTPTYADLLLQHEPEVPVDWQPRQITLGGEALRSSVGRRLARRFPGASFSVIYAATEFGVILKTHRLDGWFETAGFAKRGREWRVVDGCLELKDSTQWRATHDCVEVCDDLLRILGRSDAVANVAGTKVNLNQVTLLAEEVDGVRRAIAKAEPSPITGQMVCLWFEVESGLNPDSVREGLEHHLHASLPRASWPRKWVPARLGLGPNAKRTPEPLNEGRRLA